MTFYGDNGIFAHKLRSVISNAVPCYKHLYRKQMLMNKLTNLSLILLFSTLSSLAHGSMLSRLKSAAATRAARSVAFRKAVARNMETEVGKGKSQWCPLVGFTSGSHQVAKDAILGIAVGGVSFGATLAAEYGFNGGKKSSDPMDYYIPTSAAIVSSTVAGGIIGLVALSGAVTAAGCAKAAKIKLDEHKAVAAKKTK